MMKLIETYNHWPTNAAIPVPLDDCATVIAEFGSAKGPSDRQAIAIAKRLMSKWPWLQRTEQDLSVYVEDITAIFAAFSIDAAKHILDPVKGPSWERDMPPAGTALRRELEAFDGRRKAAVRAARWIIEEAKRREAEAQRDALIARERAERKAKGLPPLPSVAELLRK